MTKHPTIPRLQAGDVIIKTQPQAKPPTTLIVLSNASFNHVSQRVICYPFLPKVTKAQAGLRLINDAQQKLTGAVVLVHPVIYELSQDPPIKKIAHLSSPQLRALQQVFIASLR